MRIGIQRAAAIAAIAPRVAIRINAVATIELANPRNHSDGGKPWYCDGLISRGPQAPMSRRVAAR